MRDEEAVMLAVIGVVFLGILLFSLAVQGLVCWLASGSLKRIPERYREQTPGMVWLLMIPCFNLIWNFLVFPKIAASFQSYFRDHESQFDVGDCGESIATYTCIAGVCQFVPFLNYLAGPVYLVLIIVTLVKFHTLKGYIPEGAYDEYGDPHGTMK